MNDERKVIPLKTKFKKPVSAMGHPNDMRLAATGTMAFLMVLMIGFNFNMFEVRRANQAEADKKMARGIASVPQLIQPQWQQSLANLSRNMVTQSAHKPTALESLSYGLLEGKYAMSVEGGRLTQIRFSDEATQPKIVGDRISFIEKYAVALAPGFKAAEKMRVEASQIGFKEVYKVDTDSGSKVFEFEIDDQDRFISLDIR